MLYNLHFFSSKYRLFHNATLFGFCITHILNTGCAKIRKKKSVAKRLMLKVELQLLLYGWCLWRRNNFMLGRKCFYEYLGPLTGPQRDKTMTTRRFQHTVLKKSYSEQPKLLADEGNLPTSFPDMFNFEPTLKLNICFCGGFSHIPLNEQSQLRSIFIIHSYAFIHTGNCVGQIAIKLFLLGLPYPWWDR